MVEQEGRHINGVGSPNNYGSIPVNSSINFVNEGSDQGKKVGGVTWPDGRGKAVYVIILLTLLNAANKMDRYVLIEVIKEMAHDLEFGDRSCLNATIKMDPTDSVDEREKYKCDPQRCKLETDIVRMDDTASNMTSCQWVYWGTGLEYQLLAGPAFIVVVGLMRIPLIFAMEHGRIKERNIIVACAVAWSAATLLTGFATQVWHVYVCRALLGLFQAPFSPFSVALVTTYSPPQLRGLAMSILSSGIAIGYALAYGLGFLKEYAGWRWAYWVAGIPGILVAIVMLFTLQNPAKLIQKQTSQSLNKMGRSEQLIFLNWATIIPLSLGSALRFGATYIYNYNINNYLLHYYPHFHVHNYLSWTPFVSGFGSILFGGILSDVARRRCGLEGRMCMLIALSVICAPVMTSIFFLDPPNVFAASSIGTSIADSWTGATVSTLTELIPPGLRPSFFAVYFCLINTVGGTLNITLPVLRQAMMFRYAMIIAIVGLISLGTALFTLGFFAMICSRRRSYVVCDDGKDDNENDTEDANENEIIPTLISSGLT